MCTSSLTVIGCECWGSGPFITTTASMCGQCSHVIIGFHRVCVCRGSDLFANAIAKGYVRIGGIFADERLLFLGRGCCHRMLLLWVEPCFYYYRRTGVIFARARCDSWCCCCRTLGRRPPFPRALPVGTNWYYMLGYVGSFTLILLFHCRGSNPVLANCHGLPLGSPHAKDVADSKTFLSF